jgi:predicted Zn-dependent protease
LCLEEEAESKCEGLIQSALALDTNNYEALLTLANFRISQNQIEEAFEAVERSLNIWSMIPFESEEYPTYEFRLVTARLLIELSQADFAKPILEVLCQEDDSLPEPWYLLAFSNFLISQAEEYSNMEGNEFAGDDDKPARGAVQCAGGDIFHRRILMRSVRPAGKIRVRPCCSGCIVRPKRITNV